METLTPKEKLDALEASEFFAARSSHDQYRSNEIAADKAYKGKMMYVAGKVLTVEERWGVMIALACEYDAPGVQCRLTRRAFRQTRFRRLRRGNG